MGYLRLDAALTSSSMERSSEREKARLGRCRYRYPLIRLAVSPKENFKPCPQRVHAFFWRHENFWTVWRPYLRLEEFESRKS